MSSRQPRTELDKEGAFARSVPVRIFALMLYIRFSRPVARQPFPSHKAVTSKFRNAFKPECPLHTRCLPPDTNAGKAKETYDSIVVLGGRSEALSALLLGI